MQLSSWTGMSSSAGVAANAHIQFVGVMMKLLW
jgi:hypothetical protein